MTKKDFDLIADAMVSTIKKALDFRIAPLEARTAELEQRVLELEAALASRMVNQ